MAGMRSAARMAAIDRMTGGDAGNVAGPTPDEAGELPEDVEANPHEDFEAALSTVENVMNAVAPDAAEKAREYIEALRGIYADASGMQEGVPEENPMESPTGNPLQEGQV